MTQLCDEWNNQEDYRGRSSSEVRFGDANDVRISSCNNGLQFVKFVLQTHGIAVENFQRVVGRVRSAQFAILEL